MIDMNTMVPFYSKYLCVERSSITLADRFLRVLNVTKPHACAYTCVHSLLRPIDNYNVCLVNAVSVIFCERPFIKNLKRESKKMKRKKNLLVLRCHLVNFPYSFRRLLLKDHIDVVDIPSSGGIFMSKDKLKSKANPIMEVEHCANVPVLKSKFIYFCCL